MLRHTANTDFMNNSHDLFLLMFNLSQMRDKGIIVVHFQDCISEIFHPLKFSFTEQKPSGNKYSEEIFTRNLSFGYISSGKIPTDEVRKLLQNAIQMLAVILDRLNFENELITKAHSLETVARQRLSEINNHLDELQNAKLASLNLIEDLKEEIAERKQVENALLLKNFVFDASLAANSISDLNGLITEVNEAFVRIWGYSGKEEVLGKLISEFIFNAGDTGIIVSALKEIGTWEGDYTAKKKDGSTFIAHSLATVVKDQNGSNIGYQSAVIDVTDKKQAEEDIRKLNEELENRVVQRTEQLEAANKELEAFSYSVSHDLRAPLRAVNSFTNILLEDYEASLDAEGKRICRVISSSAKQMGELIDDLLNFSRIGRSTVNSTMLDMKNMANTVYNEITNDNEKNRIKLHIGNLHKVYVDPGLIKLVWNNLISNAIKYSSKNTVSEISVGSSLNGDMVTFFVKDNGVGFDMEYKHKLFGVFQRLHGERDFEGNGVGLAIVKRIILKHGGKVWAEGAVGKGATFFFSLPVSEEWEKG
jgi:PAS domain S-box-containing protein